jgi:hypothetical protein
LTEAGETAFGQSVVDHNGKLYLAAGGSDFLAEYDKEAGGARGWVRDTSGSAVAVYDGQLVVGGHFYEVAGDDGDSCWAGRPGDVDKNGIPTLDPNGKCETRQGIAAYSLPGQGSTRRSRNGLRLTRAATAWCGSCTSKGSGCTPAESSRRSAGGTELIRAALAGFAVGGSIWRSEDLVGRSPGTPLEQFSKRMVPWLRRAGS